ncbi:MAG: hypothetical protein ABUK01_11135 [Leptospirales bacterium]
MRFKLSKSRVFVGFILSCAFFTTIAAVEKKTPDYSNYPKDTKDVKNPVDTKDPVVKNPDVRKVAEKVIIRSIVTLGSRDVLEGSIILPKEFTFQHYKNGLTYTKKVQAKELKSVKISAYELRKKVATNNGTFYEFEPSEILVTLHDKTVFHLDTIFPFLRSFQFKSQYGVTRLYTYFGDTFTNSGWTHVKSKDLDYHLKIGHPAAVQTITFMK